MEKRISDSIDPHSLQLNKLRAFWAIDQLTEDGNDRFSCGHIAKFLIEKVGINVSRHAIGYGLKSDKKATHKNAYGYKLMEPGKEQLRAVLPKDERVVMIEPGKPFSTKHVVLKQIFEDLQGVVCISDPYVDVKTLDLIFKNLGLDKPVRLLTATVNDKPLGSFGRHLSDLRNEGMQIEVAIYSKSELHDRYFFDDSVFWLSGNSLNGLGMKESFLVCLGEDIRQSMNATFNRRWKDSQKI